MSKEKRVRAVAQPGTDVGPMRHDLYRQGFAQIKKALEQGLYLEAITLIESLIADRLESWLSHQKGADFSFKTLGTLINESKNHTTDPELTRLVGEELDPWRVARNKALHEIVKLKDGASTTWDDRVAEVKPVAEDGLTLLRAIDRRHQAQQRSAAATNPAPESA